MANQLQNADDDVINKVGHARTRINTPCNSATEQSMVLRVNFAHRTLKHRGSLHVRDLQIRS